MLHIHEVQKTGGVADNKYASDLQSSDPTLKRTQSIGQYYCFRGVATTEAGTQTALIYDGDVEIPLEDATCALKLHTWMM